MIQRSQPIIMVRPVWTLSNALSILRIALLIPILYFLLYASSNGRAYAAALMVLAMFTDFFDGFIARQLHQESEFGRVIDPLADKICAGAVVIVLTASGDLPAWFLIALLGRDVLILLGGLYVARVKNIVLASNWVGKLAITAVALLIILATLRIETLETLKVVALWLSTGLLALSLLLYGKRFCDTVFTKAGWTH